MKAERFVVVGGVRLDNFGETCPVCEARIGEPCPTPLRAGCQTARTLRCTVAISTSIGVSGPQSLEWIVAQLRQLKPRAILDVGCGWGRWGMLAREFLELYAHRYRKPDWQVRIDAVDIHPGTWTPVHAYLYDHTITTDIRAFATPKLEIYDVILACDVLEHLPKADALAEIARFRAAGAHVLVGLPLGPGWARPGFDGNPHEAHLSEWSEYDPVWADAAAAKTLVEEQGLGYGLYHFRGVRP